MVPMSASIKSIDDTTSSEYLPRPAPKVVASWMLNWLIYWGHIIGLESRPAALPSAHAVEGCQEKAPADPTS